jgi:hypothetical protein
VDRIPYRPVEHSAIYDLPGIVSRKKQLVPMLSSLLKAGTGTRSPFGGSHESK